MKFSENFQNIALYWPVQFYLIIFKTDWFIAKTKMVSVQLGHSVYTLYNGWLSIIYLYSLHTNPVMGSLQAYFLEIVGVHGRAPRGPRVTVCNL